MNDVEASRSILEEQQFSDLEDGEIRKEPADQEVAPIVKFRRIRTVGNKLFPQIFNHPRTLESVEYHRRSDPEDNAKSSPPDDELIDLRCLWIVEFYTPAHTERLLEGFESLGWNEEDDARPGRTPSGWIQRIRERPYGAGRFNLGTIRSPGTSSTEGIFRTAPLPLHVERAIGNIISVTSSLTCIATCFIFDDEFAQRFDQSLRTDRRTFFEPINRGHLIKGPGSQKTDNITSIREEARNLATSWITEHLPGLFSSGILNGEFPTCEFLTLRAKEPFPALEGDGKKWSEYLSILDVDHGFDIYVSDDIPGLKFSPPSDRRDGLGYHAILAMKEGDLEKASERSWGQSNRVGQVSMIDERISATFGRWAILPMLAGYARHLNTMRDSSELRQGDSRNIQYVLDSLGRHVAYNIDISSVVAELIPYTEDITSFDYGVGEFRPSDRSWYKDPEHTLAKGLRYQIQSQARWLQNSDQSLRNILTQYGSLIASQENVRVQRTIRQLTVVIAILTVLLFGTAAMDSGFVAKLLTFFRF